MMESSEVQSTELTPLLVDLQVGTNQDIKKGTGNENAKLA